MQKVNSCQITDETLVLLFVHGESALINYYTWRVFAYANLASTSVWPETPF